MSETPTFFFPSRPVACSRKCRGTVPCDRLLITAITQATIPPALPPPLWRLSDISIFFPPKFNVLIYVHQCPPHTPFYQMVWLPVLALIGAKPKRGEEMSYVFYDGSIKTGLVLRRKADNPYAPLYMPIYLPVPSRDDMNQCQCDVCVSASAHRWQNHSENTTPCKVASAGCSPLHLSHTRREHGTIRVVIGMATELLYNFLAFE